MYDDDDEAIRLSVESIWSSMFDLSVEAEGVTMHDEPRADVPERASVVLSGQRDVEVVLHCSTALATRLAGIMFALPPDEVDADLRADAVSELVNVIAGNVKVLFPTPTGLSLPAASCPDSGVTAWPVVSCHRFTCLGEPLAVMVRAADDVFGLAAR